tara:strand:- start:1735 stop:2148 length:414 start_codon:yes stop_codon:yes gene_type:complete
MPANDPAAYDAMSTDKLGGDLSTQLDQMVQTAMDLEYQETPPGSETDLPEDLSATLEDEVEPSVAADVEGAVAEVMAASPASPEEFISNLRSAGYELVKAGGPAVPETAEMAPIPDEMPMREATRAAAERALGGGVA